MDRQALQAGLYPHPVYIPTGAIRELPPGPYGGARDPYRHARGRKPPIVISSEGETPAPVADRKYLPPRRAEGHAASAGVVEGLARVVIDPTHEVLHAGEILVAPFTDPGWTPLFVQAAGVVTKVGGMMTHGAVVAREYGIPAGVSVDSAVHRTKTGQRIRVDARGATCRFWGKHEGRRKARRGPESCRRP